MVSTVESLEQLELLTDGFKGLFLIGFFGEFSRISREALPVFESFCDKNPEVRVFQVDVAQTKDIHKKYGVYDVPMVISVEDNNVRHMLPGLQTVSAYQGMINHPESASEPKDGKKEKPKQVDVYTTSSCSWCVRVKDYFNKQGVRFKEINVENNPDAAQLMVRKTGQRGVPQISINGAWVVGFDKPKINALLGISGN